MFRRLSRRLNNVYRFCDLFKETPVRSGFTPKAKKKCNYNLYAVSIAQSAAQWARTVGVLSRYTFRWSFLIWTFLYGSLSSRSLYASGYCHVNKTHFHKKGLTLFNNFEIFWISKRPYSLLEKWRLICSAERGWLRSLQASRLPIGGIQAPLRLLTARNISLTCEKRR